MTEDFDPDVESDEPDDGFADVIDEDSPLKDLEYLRSRVARFLELRNAKDEAKNAEKKASAEFAEFQAEFFEELEKSPLEGSVKVRVGDALVQLVPRKTRYGRVLDYDKAIEYFKKRNKLDEYTRDDFRMGRLHELVREHIEQKKPLPDGIDYYTKEYFTMTVKD